MMDFEYQDEPEADAGSGPSYDGSAGNPHPRHPTETEEPQPQPPPPRKSRYRECLKNHAVGIGGHAVDGCGEFMPAGEEGTIESLKCAACNCHRNFHRRDNNDNGGRQHTHHHQHQHQHQHQLLLGYHGQFGYRSPTGYLQVPQLQHQRPAPLALPSSSGGGGGSRDDAEDYYSNRSSSGGQKRFRTKFSQEQKDRMLDLATRLDWKIQKQDEDLVQQMCTEIGVKRHVFKVWMHNNKQTLEILL